MLIGQKKKYYLEISERYFLLNRRNWRLNSS